MEGQRKFTKLLKAPLSLLKKLERVLKQVIVDLITMDWSYLASFKNITNIIKQMLSLGLLT